MFTSIDSHALKNRSFSVLNPPPLHGSASEILGIGNDDILASKTSSSQISQKKTQRETQRRVGHSSSIINPAHQKVLLKSSEGVTDRFTAKLRELGSKRFFDDMKIVFDGELKLVGANKRGSEKDGLQDSSGDKDRLDLGVSPIVDVKADISTYVDTKTGEVTRVQGPGVLPPPDDKADDPKFEGNDNRHGKDINHDNLTTRFTNSISGKLRTINAINKFNSIGTTGTGGGTGGSIGGTGGSSGGTTKLAARDPTLDRLSQKLDVDLRRLSYYLDSTRAEIETRATLHEKREQRRALSGGNLVSGSEVEANVGGDINTGDRSTKPGEDPSNGPLSESIETAAAAAGKNVNDHLAFLTSELPVKKDETSTKKAAGSWKLLRSAVAKNGAAKRKARPKRGAGNRANIAEGFLDYVQNAVGKAARGNPENDVPPINYHPDTVVDPFSHLLDGSGDKT